MPGNFIPTFLYRLCNVIAFIQSLAALSQLSFLFQSFFKKNELSAFRQIPGQVDANWVKLEQSFPGFLPILQNFTYFLELTVTTFFFIQLGKIFIPERDKPSQVRTLKILGSTLILIYFFSLIRFALVHRFLVTISDLAIDLSLFKHIETQLGLGFWDVSLKLILPDLSGGTSLFLAIVFYLWAHHLGHSSNHKTGFEK
jgi:hypothetical protein